MTTRIIRITECAQCPHRRGLPGFMFCIAADNRPTCPPTGTPDWCPLEVLEAERMNPPPLDMKQAQECLRGTQQQLQACIELRRAASMRITDLEAENAALKDRIKWWYEPCPNCGAPEGMALTSNGFNDTRVWCCLCRHDGKGVQGPIGKETDHEAIRLWNEESRLRWNERRERIAALEAELAVATNDATCWRNAHDKISEYAAGVEETAKASIAECAEELAALRGRVKTLEDMLAFDKHSWQFHEPSYAALCLAEQRISFGKFCEYMRGLRDGKTDPIVKGVTPSMESQIAERIQELEAENAALRAELAALREDKARLDRLERELKHNPAWTACFLTISMSHDGKNFDAINVEFAEDFPNDEAVEMSNPTLRGALDKAFAHLDAARKGGKG